MHGIQISVLGFIVPLKPWQNSDMRATNVDALKGVASMCFTWPGKKKKKKSTESLIKSSQGSDSSH